MGGRANAIAARKQVERNAPSLTDEAGDSCVREGEAAVVVQQRRDPWRQLRVVPTGINLARR